MLIGSLPINGWTYKFLSRSYYLSRFIFNNHRLPKTNYSDLRDFLYYRQFNGKLLEEFAKSLTHKGFGKDFIRKKLGAKYTIKTLSIIRNQEDIQKFETAEYPLVIKPVHSCGRYFIINSHDELRQKEEQIIGWLGHDYFLETLEENYFGLEKALIIEPYIKKEYFLEGSLHCLAGKVKIISLIDRFDSQKRRESFSRSMQPLGVSLGQEYKKINISSIQCFNDLILKAEALVGEIDYIRVDFYLGNTDFLFGELTNLPAGGALKFYPPEMDFKFNDALFN